MDATAWDERYRDRELVWGAPPNRFVVEELGGLGPRRALDLACGEGRNARWLAARGWTVTGVDFSPVAIEKAARLDAEQPDATHPRWRCADVTSFVADEPVDVALLCYLQLADPDRGRALRAAAAALAPGGTLLVVAHASRNLTEGTGGPQHPANLYAPADVVADLAGTGLVVERAEEVLREVEGAERPAIDTLVRARRP